MTKFIEYVANLTTSVAGAQDSNNRMETTAECKLLDLNLDKSVYMVVGNTKEKQIAKIATASTAGQYASFK